jgi:hypothetical protein
VGKPIDHLARTGDVVELDSFTGPKMTGIVLRTQNDAKLFKEPSMWATNWAEVEWYSPEEDVSKQWHPVKVLTVISRA